MNETTVDKLRADMMKDASYETFKDQIEETLVSQYEFPKSDAKKLASEDFWLDYYIEDWDAKPAVETEMREAEIVTGDYS